MIKFLSLIFLVTKFSFPSFASSTQLNNLFDSLHPILSLSGGPGWIKPGETQNVYLDYDYNNGYISNSKEQAVGFAEIFLGLQKSLATDYANQFGVAFSGSWMAKLSGEVWQFNEPLFYNYDYTYNIRQLRLALRDKFIYEKGLFSQKINPYISGSVGLGFNKSYSYSETPLASDIVSTPAFANNAVTAFTYSIGAGLQSSLWEHVIFAVGYEFFDWGRSALGTAPGQVLNNTPSVSHLYMNSLLFSMTYTV